MKMKASGLLVGFFLCVPGLRFLGAEPAEGKAAWWPPEVEKSLARSQGNRPELLKALADTPGDQRKGMAFLVANMPDHDLQSLSAAFLRENVALAYQARQQVPWGGRIPEDIFLNDILPYANVDEARHPWRKQLSEICLPLVKECRTPGEAAQRLNATIFKTLRVRFSTERQKPHQSPKETMESGLASCSGLSILLSDACRSVAVPARLAGTPLWANKRGNHTWVEVWDAGWHFTGAAEPDAKGLDHAWFEADAAQADKEFRLHAIYAASFRKTEVTFPLVWAPDRKDVYAENVTARYARPKAAGENRTRVMIRVLQAGSGKRAALPVAVVEAQDPNKVFRGESRGERADPNDLLTFELPRGRDYLLRLGRPVRLEKPFRTAAAEQQLLEVEVPPQKAREPAESPGLPEDQERQIDKAARAYFTATDGERADWKFEPALDNALALHEQAVRRAVWKAYQAAPVHASIKADFDDNRVRFEQHLSPYTVKRVGRRPKNGWPLFIAMHGGGGAPKEVNDSQWKVMQGYYRAQESVAGYHYLALRAPNDTWNGFYDEYVPPLVINLIRQFLLFGDVDPDKVSLMGYSHGGYGAFFVGPKIPDRFAAVHSSAAAPTDGAISPRTLRNTRFTYMVGERDDAYGRRQRCEAFDEAVQKLKEQDPGAYPVEMELKKGFGHTGLPDRDKIKELYPFTRDPVPPHLTWDLTDPVIAHFFWLAVPQPGKDQGLDATIDDNLVRITTRKVADFDLNLDSRLVSFDWPVRISVDGKAQELKATPRFLTLCESMRERGDPELAYACRIRLKSERK
jgi:hypothetical protein